MRTLVPDANTGNRISIQGDDVVIGLDDYKTIGTHGPQVFTISTDANLVRELRRLLEHRKPGDPLLFGQDSVPFPPSAFTHLMTKSLSDEVGKHVTVQIARKILAKASWLENPSRNAMEHISRYDFHHYLVTHLSYNQYHPGTETADGDALSDPSDEPLELAEHVGTPGSFDIAGLAASFEGDDARSLVAPPTFFYA
ncbi:hypothetical protein CXG81DRAFT_27379 [Caulochytrium protostelioides]|uniref:Uncharacterized protein n=1 Tax=Caulochytrium protostelioides TaxID=1555241 RepID=A0A4P9X4D3_9FUNG|nr:hypothetical protein CXG81DRAFT_27379 [Caulochytrium protostelioides]|eukprot:RKO99900.1 hypothetical protein CXG81DRAFT_27379 [Caulochytrium protostelioides]